MEKKTPLRQCIACRERKPKKELLRIIRTPEETVHIDETGKANGRGAYLCRQSACIALARKKNLLRNALKTTVDESVYEEILRYVER